MSLILDALNKADRDRDYGDGVPDLKTTHHSAASRGRRDRWLLILASIIVVLLLVVAVLVVLWLRSDAPYASPVVGNEPIHADESVATPAAPGENPTPDTVQNSVANTSGANNGAVNASAAETPVPAPGGSEQNEAAVDPEVQALYQVQYGEVQVVEPVVQPAASEQRQQQTSVDEGLARALWEQTRTQPLPSAPLAEQVIKPEPVEVEPDVDLDVDADFESTIAAFDDVPFLHELPVALQNRIPTLMYAQHSFDAQSVTINKKTFTVGDNIGDSVVVERILADGVLLNYEGEQFKLAALSSWVNY